MDKRRVGCVDIGLSLGLVLLDPLFISPLVISALFISFRLIKNYSHFRILALSLIQWLKYFRY